MSFAIFVDGSSNLPDHLLRELELSILPCSYTLNGTPSTYNGNLASFHAHEYYEMLRQGAKVQTSLLNTQLFLDSFRPELVQGRDVLYFSMSSGISGTCQAGRIAAEELGEEFPERTVRVIDSLGSGFGTGLMACKASDLRAQGKTAAETADIMDADAHNMLQFFTVDDLNFLKRTGRVSGATAMIGTVLNIKPVLWGDSTGHITARGKHRGRKKALAAIVEEYRSSVIDPEHQRVAISHGDCEAEANQLADMIRAVAPPRELIIAPHEPFTGAHVGPGMLALFFHGKNRNEI
ncbi:MAG: DegV family protein [Faecousia sp.]